MGPENQAAVLQAAARGLVINAYTESWSVAEGLQRQGIQAVCVVPPDAPAMFGHVGVRFVACPDPPAAGEKAAARSSASAAAGALASPSAPRPIGRS
jgi:hypothetical protein